jgi:hypothetical protein
MKLLKKILFILAAAFILIQFIRPEKNRSDAPSGNGVAKQFVVPADVQRLLKNSCYNCHSNNTVYPWYAEVQPVGWWLGKHIRNGKAELNFDEFATYRPMRQYKKSKEVEEQIRNDEMPLPAYTLIHRNAILSADEKAMLINWSVAMRDSMKARYPLDSLERKPTRK